MQNRIGNKILSVKNLRVSFWTNNGTVKAVRGVSFDLYKGRTLAIVGESGSGKSQTSRAIMGLLAPNRIIEEGEILYDGRDILRLKEEELCGIRGSRIAMVFQDPMSSLNPIVKVGKQIVEAMYIKQNRSLKESRARALYLKKALLKDNPESKGILIHYEKGEIDQSALLPLAKKTVERVRKEILYNASSYRDELKRLLNSGVFSEENHAFLGFKKELPILKKMNKGIENRLSETKDDFVFTFVLTMHYYFREYKKALKREKIAAKLALKNENRRQKGKKAKEMDLSKNMAYASEIDDSSSAISRRAKEYLSSFISHLEHRYSFKEKADVTSQAQDLVGSYFKALHNAKKKIDKKGLTEKAIELLSEVGIKEPEKRMEQYPFQLSGGMRQRVVISIALSSDPEILICDEPTTALDVTIQAQILDLINDLKKKRKLSVIFITHNLGVVANIADDIAILYAGKIVERGTAEDIFYHPAHPYTWALLSSLPDLATKNRLDSIPGRPPSMIVPPKGDAFASRNKYALEIDFEEEPPFFIISKTHEAATWLLDSRAPQVDPPKSVTDRIARFKKLNERELTLRKEKSNEKKHKNISKKQ